jgi:porin
VAALAIMTVAMAAVAQEEPEPEPESETEPPAHVEGDGEAGEVGTDEGSDTDTDADADTGADADREADADTDADDTEATADQPAEPEEEPEPQTKAEYVEEMQEERESIEAGPDGVINTIVESQQAPPAVFEPFEEFQTIWRDANARLDEDLGLSFSLAYTLVYQYATAGPIGDAAVGDFDFNATWHGIREEGWSGFLGLRTEVRHRLTDFAPSDLGPSFGSLWNTVSGFNSQDFLIAQLWWQQNLLNDRIVTRIGKIDQSDFASAGRFTSANFYFLNPAFASNPAIAYPEAGLGAAVTVWPLERLYLQGTFGDANARKNETSFQQPDVKEFFTSAEVGFLTKFDGIGRGAYRFTGWFTDSRAALGLPSGRGGAVSMHQEIGERFIPFLRYGWSDGNTTDVRQLLATGVVIKQPLFQPENLLGIAFAWGEPSDQALRDQYVFEAFYRLQVTPTVQFTPDIQLIFDPSRNPNEDVVAVLGARLRVTF